MFAVDDVVVVTAGEHDGRTGVVEWAGGSYSAVVLKHNSRATVFENKDLVKTSAAKAEPEPEINLDHQEKVEKLITVLDTKIDEVFVLATAALLKGRGPLKKKVHEFVRNIPAPKA